MAQIKIDLTMAPDKFREVILYIAEKCETDQKFGMTKLNKILFYADFISFGKTGRSITGQTYQKLKWGPCARGMKPASQDMESNGELAIRPRSYLGYTQQKPIALRPPKLEIILSSEIAIIDQVIEDVRNMSANEISDLSHSFVGWEIAEIGENIPYPLAWVDDKPDFTEEEKAVLAQIPPLSKEEKASIRCA